MSFRLPDKWVWDFWFAHDKGEHHLFYLQAPVALGQPGLRHQNASIGHAVSTDLYSWTVLEDALHPGPAGAWDDLATWTGSVIEHEGRWYMFYTGIGRAEFGLVQRIGLATSDDLITWEKHPANPLIEPDRRWYGLCEPENWRDQSWRDPWVFKAEHDGSFHALITARARIGPLDGRGVVAHARSVDLIQWEVMPPLTAPGDFAQVECPQLVQIDDRYYILFSCLGEDHSQSRVARLGTDQHTGTFAFSSAELLGPYTNPIGSLAPSGFADERLYAGKLVEHDGQLWFMAFRAGGDDGRGGQLDDDDFVGELTDPLPIHLDADGGLHVDVSRESALTRALRAIAVVPQQVRD
jgi:beta-fructofuranosidase